ncbi:MAG: DUF3368 domain-containing protein [Candidatus Bipolaricaulota bacterium]|nr:DUF3368 domain-containing protein [Candidatus Bipolaricaulota bacterium]
MKPIVADSDPLIAFVRIERLELLKKLYNQILIPPAVAKEIAPPDVRKKNLIVLQAHPWISVQELQDPQMLNMVSARLGEGERAAIALAYEQDLELFTDDAEARKEAQRLGIPVFGSLAALLDAKERGFIPKVKPLLDALVKKGFWISPKLYQDVLTSAGESKRTHRE